MSLGLPDRPLPLRVRPFHLETQESYWQRLADENFEPPQRLKTYATTLRKARPDLTHHEAARLVIEALGELQEGHFTTAITDLAPHPNGEYCPYCILGVDLPLLCRRCAHGKLVTQYPNLRMVCLKHRVWTGFTAAHTDQVTVGKSVLQSEKKLRRLIRCGRVDTVLIQKSRKLLLGGREGSNADVEIFPDLVALVQLLTSPWFTSQLLAPLQSFRAARKLLETHTLSVLTGTYPGLVEGIWSQYRPLILAIRESTRGGTVRTSPMGARPRSASRMHGNLGPSDRSSGIPRELLWNHSSSPNKLQRAMATAHRGTDPALSGSAIL